MQTIKTALCSFGMSGRVFHAPFFHAHPGFDLYAVWERSKKTAAEKYPAIKSFDLLEEMLADARIELVVVNTPNYTHYEFAKKSLLAGKHVLVEKSFTVTVSEAEELISIAKQEKKLLSVYQNRRYDSDFKTVKKVFDEGALGKITEASFYFDRFNLNLSPKQHKETKIPGAGLLHDLGPHIIDQALVLFGMPVSLSGSLKKMRPSSVVNDYFDITLFYMDFNVRVKASLVVKEQPAAYSIHGLSGSFVKMRADIQEDSLRHEQQPVGKGWGTELPGAAGILSTTSDGKTASRIIQSLQGNYMEFYEALYQAIANNHELPVSAGEGLRVMRIIEAVQQSHNEGKVIEFSNERTGQ